MNRNRRTGIWTDSFFMNAKLRLLLLFVFRFVTHHRSVSGFIKLNLVTTNRLEVIKVRVLVIKIFWQIHFMQHFSHFPFFIDLLCYKRILKRWISYNSFGLFVFYPNISHFYTFLHVFESIYNRFVFYHFFLSWGWPDFVREQILILVVVKGLVIILALFFSSIIFLFHGLRIDHNYLISQLNFFQIGRASCRERV